MPSMDRPSPPPPSSRRRRAAASLLVVAALSAVLAGCGGGTSTGGSTPSGTTGAAGAKSTTTTTSSNKNTTGTASSGTTTTTSTTSLPGTGKPAVTIGDENYGEQFVLGQLYLKALQAQGFDVNINPNIGPTSVVLGSLKDDHLAMYPEYLNTIDETFAHSRKPAKTLNIAYARASRWAARNGLVLLTPTPFSDTPGIAVTDIFASRHRLKTLGDLLGVANSLVVGGAVQFKSDQGLASGYGVSPVKFVPLAVGSQYSALDANTVQAAYVRTTDGELATGDYRVLGDPQNIFGYGNVVPVITQKAFDAEGPAFMATIERVDRTLTLSAMRQLDNAVDVAKLPPATVAEQYLQTHGLLDPLLPGDY